MLVHQRHSLTRGIKLKTKKLTPTPLWRLRSCNCHTGPEDVSHLSEQNGSSNKQVNICGTLLEGSIACVLSFLWFRKQLTGLFISRSSCKMTQSTSSLVVHWVQFNVVKLILHVSTVCCWFLRRTLGLTVWVEYQLDESSEVQTILAFFFLATGRKTATYLPTRSGVRVT